MINYKNLLLTTSNLARSKVDYKLTLVFKKKHHTTADAFALKTIMKTVFFNFILLFCTAWA